MQLAGDGMTKSELPFTICEFSMEALIAMMSESSEASAEAVSAKTHLHYLREYFLGIGARTILAEKNYIDHDYLEDYSGYYVRCFHRYRRRCTRIHFFRSSFTEEQFHQAVESRSIGSLIEPQESSTYSSYLGFIVVRPLPRFVIGRTCLVPYEDEPQRRTFPTRHNYAVNIYGHDLELPTVAFQEQDTVTAACATSALWSAFQVTGRRFQHQLPSPVQITRSATDHSPLRSRPFPNTDGLTLEQMALAIRNVGLEPFLIAPTTPFFLKSACHAYLKAGIPILLVHELTQQKGSGRERIGFHAVAVTGVSLPPAPEGTVFGPHSFTCDRINKIYVHDDQVGPYARMEFKESGGDWWLDTFWGNGAASDVRAIPRGVLVPLYNKIRIPAKLIYQEVVNLATILTAMGVTDLDWDVYLTSNNDLKRSIIGGGRTAASHPHDILLQDLPRFMWRVRGARNDTVVFDLLFDATDIDSGQYILRFDICDQDIVDAFSAFANDATLSATPVGEALSRFLQKRRSRTAIG